METKIITNKREAIRITREAFGNLYKFGTQYRFNYYYRACNAWRESTPRDYWSALATRAQMMLDHARELMGKDPVQIVEGASWHNQI